jgi:hypothetical protein
MLETLWTSCEPATHRWRANALIGSCHFPMRTRSYQKGAVWRKAARPWWEVLRSDQVHWLVQGSPDVSIEYSAPWKLFWGKDIDIGGSTKPIQWPYPPKKNRGWKQHCWLTNGCGADSLSQSLILFPVDVGQLWLAVHSRGPLVVSPFGAKWCRFTVILQWWAAPQRDWLIILHIEEVLL